MLTPLERARSEYRRVALAGDSRARILRHVLQRTECSSVSWSKSIGVGFVTGSLALGAWFLMQRDIANAPNRSSAVAVLHDVRGTVQSRSDRGVESHQLASEQTVPGGTWLETQHAASLRVAVGPHRVSIAEDTRLRLERLEPKHLGFALAQGSAHFEVEPLPPSGTLVVQAGELMVQVVGTAFSVSRVDDCSALQVTKGRVLSTFRGQSELVGSGESRRYCERSEAGIEASQQARPIPKETRTASESSAHPVSIPNASVQVTNADRNQETPADLGSSSASTPLTEEEAGFRRGVQALQSVNVSLARDNFEAYLRNHPDGSYVQDARFQLVRLHYAAGAFSQTVIHGKRYLASSAENDVRSNEVRLLLAQSLLHQGNAVGEAYALLAPLVKGTVPSGAHAEQALYLYILAASRSGRHEEARTWAERYVVIHPNGSYSAEVRKFIVP